MKAKLLGTALFVLTAAAAYPALKSGGSINTAPIDSGCRSRTRCRRTDR
jgi:hypothetical protein